MYLSSFGLRESVSRCVNRFQLTRYCVLQIHQSNQRCLEILSPQAPSINFRFFCGLNYIFYAIIANLKIVTSKEWPFLSITYHLFSYKLISLFNYLQFSKPRFVSLHFFLRHGVFVLKNLELIIWIR